MFTKEQVYEQLKRVTMVDNFSLSLGCKFVCVMKSPGEVQGVLVEARGIQDIVNYFKQGLSLGKSVTVKPRQDIQGMRAWLYTDGSNDVQIYRVDKRWGSKQ